VLTIPAQDSKPRNVKTMFTKQKNNNQSNKKEKTTAQTAGLETNLKVGINSRIMLKKNLNNGVDALCNGALGTVKGFTFIENTNTVRSILIKLDNLEKLEEINRVTLDYEAIKDMYVARSQFPITLAWALTIHKTQGLSLDSALIDIGKDIFEPGMAYVALSRVKKLENVYLCAFEPLCMGCDELSVLEYNRLKKKFNKGNLINKYTTFGLSKNEKYRKIAKDLLTESEVLDSSSIKMATNIIPTKQLMNNKQGQLVLTPPFTPMNNNKMNKRQRTKLNKINIDHIPITPVSLEKPSVTAKNLKFPKNTLIQPKSVSDQRNENYFLKLINRSNACFTNVLIQAMISLGDTFYELVSTNRI